MNKIIYKNIYHVDHEQIEELINQAFSLYHYVEDAELLKYVKKFYLMACLAEHGFGRVALKDNRIIGIIMGDAKRHKHPLKSLYYTMKMLFYVFKVGSTGIKKITSQEGYGQIQGAYKQLIKGRKHLFNGTLTLFAVTKECRGEGVGKYLLNELMNYYNEYHTDYIYLYTDDTCNYGFYEYMGFKRINTKEIEIVKNKQIQPMQVYLYEKLITE